MNPVRLKKAAGDMFLNQTKKPLQYCRGFSLITKNLKTMKPYKDT